MALSHHPLKPKKARHPAKPPSPAAAETGVACFLSEFKAYRRHYVSLAIVCLAIIGFWIWSAEPDGLNYLSASPDKAYYNLLVQGFQSGQLNLKTELPPELAQLPDPYRQDTDMDLRWYDGHRLLDLSYYRGKLYLYFGVTPALILFWPYAAVTGHYLPEKDAALVFCAIGFLAAVGLLYALWRRCFAEVSFGVVLAGVVALGLATGLPMLLSKCNVYEVAISCGFAFVMLALTAVWGALVMPRRQGWWLAAASLAYGLAVGARPDLLFGAGMLLIPALLAWRKGQRVGGLLLAAVGPMVLVGLGLMVYNDLRFGNPLEFGLRYQLGYPYHLVHRFSLHYLWFNLCAYFLEPVRWSLSFPFVRASLPTHFPPGGGYYEARFTFGVLTAVPLIWLGLATSLTWRNRPAESGSLLRGFLGALGWLGGSTALTLCQYYWVADRFEVEFLPAFIFLALAGIFTLERGLTGQARRLARGGWLLLLAFSIGFNLQDAYERRAVAYNVWGAALDNLDRKDEAMLQYRKAIHYKPDYEEPHYNLGIDLNRQGRVDEAIHEFQEAIRLKPDYADAHNDLGDALSIKGRGDEAIRQYQEALRLIPDDTDARYNLGVAFGKQGRLDKAISQFQEILRLQPDYVEAHDGLGIAFLKTGRLDEAISQFQAALNLRPDDASAQNNFSVALQMKNAPVGH